MCLTRILDLREFDVPYADKFTKDFNDILSDDSINIVVEVMGGINPAYSFVKQCLEQGKSVVTSNKELVAAKGAELLSIARERNVNFLFEASVGGGIPIIRPMHQCLAANDIREVAGILNGTTNFILTKMIREQMSFDDALKLAQSLGYAERDPSADVEGGDACRKICILASLAYQRHVYPKWVATEGITGITLTDVKYAERCGKVIKLLGYVKKLPSGKLQIMVCPAMVSCDSQFAGVNDVFNAILVRGDATGDVIFYGRGAGKLPTASAVVADVMDAVKNSDTIRTLYWEDCKEKADCVADSGEYGVKAYVRIKGGDKTGLLKRAVVLFDGVQVVTIDEAPEDELAFVTGDITERRLTDGMAELEQMGAAILSRVRILDY